MTRLLASTLLSGMVLACGSSSTHNHDAGSAPHTAPVPESFDEAVALLEAGAPAGYSLTFFGEPPGARGLQSYAILGGTSGACADYTSHFASPEPDTSPLWLLHLNFTGAAAGEYRVTPNPPLPSAEPLVSAYLQRWQAGAETGRHTALGGSVIIEEAAEDLASWRAGVELSALVRLEFPLHNVRQLGCQGAGGDEVDPVSTCQCEDDTGTFSCERAATPDRDCCHDFESERRTVEFRITASRCASMCDVTSLIYQRNCRELAE